MKKIYEKFIKSIIEKKIENRKDWQNILKRVWSSFQKERSMRGLFKNAPLGRNQIIGLTIKKTSQLYSLVDNREHDGRARIGKNRKSNIYHYKITFLKKGKEKGYQV